MSVPLPLVDSTVINVGAATGTAGSRRALDASSLPAAAAAVAAGLSMVNPWWAAPAALAALLSGRQPGRTGPTALVLVAVLAAGVSALSIVPAWLPLGARFVTVVVFALMVPWFAGRFWCQYQELARAERQQAEQLHRERRLVADQARLRERARIARDMHDVLGHDLSLIALSAGALKLAPGLAEPHRRAAADIRARAAAAVEHLGEVIGVLREETEEAPMGQHGSGLAGLISEAAAAGLPVRLRVDGEADDLPPAVERAAHRVVQEALTNVAKHAPGAASTVHVKHASTETTVVVEKRSTVRCGRSVLSDRRAWSCRPRRTGAAGRRLLRPRPARRGLRRCRPDPAHAPVPAAATCRGAFVRGASHRGARRRRARP